MKLESTYSGRFFRARHKLNWRAPIVCKAIQSTLKPLTVIDVGCAIGDLVAEFNRIGVPAAGLEGSHAVIPYLCVPESLVLIADLRERLFFSDWFHLATCFEVAEHIEPQFADIFVENMITLSNRILMSAAPPGQGGHGHYNCQPLSYWTAKFSRFGYVRRPEVESRICAQLEPWKHKPGIKAIHQNIVYYDRF